MLREKQVNGQQEKPENLSGVLFFLLRVIPPSARNSLLERMSKEVSYVELLAAQYQEQLGRKYEETEPSSQDRQLKRMQRLLHGAVNLSHNIEKRVSLWRDRNRDEEAQLYFQHPLRLPIDTASNLSVIKAIYDRYHVEISKDPEKKLPIALENQNGQTRWEDFVAAFESRKKGLSKEYNETKLQLVMSQGVTLEVALGLKEVQINLLLKDLDGSLEVAAEKQIAQEKMLVYETRLVPEYLLSWVTKNNMTLSDELIMIDSYFDDRGSIYFPPLTSQEVKNLAMYLGTLEQYDEGSVVLAGDPSMIQIKEKKGLFTLSFIEKDAGEWMAAISVPTEQSEQRKVALQALADELRITLTSTVLRTGQLIEINKIGSILNDSSNYSLKKHIRSKLEEKGVGERTFSRIMSEELIKFVPIALVTHVQQMIDHGRLEEDTDYFVGSNNWYWRASLDFETGKPRYTYKFLIPRW